MNQTTALIRLAFSCQRRVVIAMIALVAVGQIIVWGTALLHPQWLQHNVLPMTMVCSLLPAALFSFVVFDYGFQTDLNFTASSCNHWLLRMPVAAWKIAIVPVVLRTLWVAALWTLVQQGEAWTQGRTGWPWLAPCLSLSAGTIWVMVLTWRPFANPWFRLLSLLSVAIGFYFCIALIFDGRSMVPAEWRGLVPTTGLVVAGLFYSSGVAASFAAIRLARTNTRGIVPETDRHPAVARRVLNDSVSQHASKPANFKRPYHALLWHQWIRIRTSAYTTVALYLIPAIGLYVAVVPFSGPAFIMLNVLLAYAGIFASCGNQLDAAAKQPSSLPTYLLASPISSATIAWTRAIVPMAVAAAIYLSIAAVLAGWAIWPSNRTNWIAWAESYRSWFDGQDATPMFGLRLVGSFCVAFLATYLSRAASYWWIGMTGRTWFVIAASVVGMTFYFVPLSIFLAWFMKQNDWQAVQAMGRWGWQWMPTAIFVAMACKVIAVAIAAYLLSHRRLASTRAIASVACGWVAICVILAGTLTMLIPDSRISFAWMLAAATLTVPLARIFAMPLALAWNRHR
ncbi:hypothetical protein [Rosistilla oblonga]|uniref:hypothetical protein n=1 Tax=Rosistilla oblonga TaxID=2527990 RepID=UPI003A97C1FD